jgi:hypothetical protein
MTEWCGQPLEPVYPVVFIDAIFVKIPDGQVTNRPIYIAIGVTVAKFWPAVAWRPHQWSIPLPSKTR